MVKLIVRKSDAYKIDLNTVDNFGKTGISYFEMEVQILIEKSFNRLGGAQTATPNTVD